MTEAEKLAKALREIIAVLSKDSASKWHPLNKTYVGTGILIAEKALSAFLASLEGEKL